MALRLRAVGNLAPRLGDSPSRAFGVHGGRLGRAPDNDWVLPDPDRYVSGHHAAIEYRGGQWYVLDTSSNGTFHNESGTPVRASGAQLLADGDRLRLGDYEFEITITADNDFPPDAQGGMGYEQMQSDDFAIATHGDIGADLDLKTLLEDPMPPEDESPPPPGPDPFGQTLVPPSSRRDRPRSPPTLKMPARPAAAGPARHDPQAVAALQPAVLLLLRGAGLDPSGVPADRYAQILALAGQVLREMTLGLSTALKAHADARAVGSVHREQPLAALPSTEAALMRLLVSTSGRQASPVEVVRDGFATLHHHELATSVALRMALAEYVARFAPEELETQFEQRLKRTGVVTAAPRTKYWEMYAETYRLLVQANDEGLPHAFAEAFLRIYSSGDGPDGPGGEPS
jgi:type VI secretion system protein